MSYFCFLEALWWFVLEVNFRLYNFAKLCFLQSYFIWVQGHIYYLIKKKYKKHATIAYFNVSFSIKPSNSITSYRSWSKEIHHQVAYESRNSKSHKNTSPLIWHWSTNQPEDKQRAQVIDGDFQRYFTPPQRKPDRGKENMNRFSTCDGNLINNRLHMSASGKRKKRSLIDPTFPYATPDATVW